MINKMDLKNSIEVTDEELHSIIITDIDIGMEDTGITSMSRVKA